ncbi:ATP-binding protein [Paenibacillus thalictri]|uniref:histidine kinase n=1 Tax=Paenibacillus thalictri TaxID=2527873 RepID=A0A4Q9DWI5_9BACL|nr:ATP-binding protein [Paenibacillus thalictri]TBL80107.1 HAMP domain-containing protein [Paenibacillus thalictri]
MKTNSVSRQIIWRTGAVMLLVDLVTAIVISALMGSNMNKIQEHSNFVTSQMVMSSMKEVQSRNKTIEEVLDANLYTAAKGITEELRGKQLDNVDRTLLESIVKKWDLHGLSLFVKDGSFFRIVQSSEPEEMDQNTKDWGDLWNHSFQELMDRVPVTTKEGFTRPNYWVGPASKADWNAEYYLYGYYYDGTTPFMVNPYVTANNLFDQTLGGTNRLVNSILDDNSQIKNVTVVNIEPFLADKPAKVIRPDTDAAVIVGDNKFPTADDKAALTQLTKTGKEQTYELKEFGANLEKRYIPLPDKRALMLVIDTSAQKKLQTTFTLIFFAVICIALCLNILMIRTIFKRRLKPVQEIGDYINQVSRGNFDARLEVQDKNELGWIAGQIKVMAGKIKLSVDELESKVQERTSAIQNLLNHAGQGFLSFGPGLAVDSDYSLECRRIFGKTIDKLTFPELLYDDEAERQELTEILTAFFAETDEAKRELILTLLPAEMRLGALDIHLAYRVIDRLQLMTIITDVTEQKALAEEVEREQRMLKMVVKVVTQYDDFKQLTEQYEEFSNQRLPEILQHDDASEKKFGEICRAIHTFKGNFGIYHMKGLVNKLHELETRLLDDRDDAESGALEAYLLQLPYNSWLEEELKDLHSILGESYLDERNKMVIVPERLAQLKQKIYKQFPPEQANIIISDLERLADKPFKDLLKIYPDYVADLAVRNGKAIAPLTIEGGEMLVNHAMYHSFAKSIVHIFRNMIDHGLEYPYERIKLGKDNHGQITLRIVDRMPNLVIEIGDDGRGISPSLIAATAVEQGLLSQETAARSSDSELIDYIFHNHFSTKRAADELSGRGVGLAAVKEETQRLHGSVEVQSQAGKGTLFRFILPMPT